MKAIVWKAPLKEKLIVAYVLLSVILLIGSTTIENPLYSAFFLLGVWHSGKLLTKQQPTKTAKNE
jgi:hypothetical protein